MVADYLIRGMKIHFNKNSHWKYKNDTYTNIDVLTFANDTLIFTKANVDGLTKLWKFLKHYKRKLGQKINYDKSTLIVFYRLEDEIMQNIV